MEKGIYPSEDISFGLISSFTIDNDKNIYILDSKYNSIVKLNKDGKFLWRYRIELNLLADILWHNDKLYILDSKKGLFYYNFHNQDLEKVFIPYNFIYASSVNFYRNMTFIADYGNQSIIIVKKNDINTIDFSDMEAPQGFCVLNNLIFIADWRKNCIFVIDYKKKLLKKKFGGLGLSNAKFFHPDSIINYKDFLVISDWGNNAIKVFSKDGEFVGNYYGGKVRFRNPSVIRVFKDHIFVLDSYNFKIRELALNIEYLNKREKLKNTPKVVKFSDRKVISNIGDDIAQIFHVVPDDKNNKTLVSVVVKNKKDVLKKDILPSDIYFYDGNERINAMWIGDSKSNRVILTLDVSGSIKKYLNLLKKASKEFIKKIPEDTYIKITTFNRWLLSTPFTKNKNEILAYIRQITVSDITRLYDTLYNIIIEYGNISKFKDLPVIILISDGRDENIDGSKPGSIKTLDDIKNLLKLKKIPIYCIAIGEDINKEVLETLALSSNGKIYYLKDESKLNDALNSLLNEIKNYKIYLINKKLKAKSLFGEVIH